MTHIIGIMAMLLGFIAMFIENYGGAFACFFFAFLLWCILAFDEYIEYRKKKNGGDKHLKPREYQTECIKAVRIIPYAHILNGVDLDKAVDDLKCDLAKAIVEKACEKGYINFESTEEIDRIDGHKRFVMSMRVIKRRANDL